MTRDEIPKLVSDALSYDVRWADQSQVLCDASLLLEVFDVSVPQQSEMIEKLMELQAALPEMETVAGGSVSLIFRKSRKSVQT